MKDTNVALKSCFETEGSILKKIVVDKEIFDLFPGFKRGIIIVKDIENSSRNEKITKLLDEIVISRIGKEWLEHEYVKAWEEAHRKFGSKPKRYPPSVKQLLRRIQKVSRVPFINSVVASFNYISLKYLVPCGGDDVDKIEGNLRLGLAKGNEVFIPLGGGEVEHPKPGEVIYYDDKTLNVMCRRWNWRNGDFSKITETSKKIVINVDGIGPIPQSLIEEARDELAKLLIEECNADLKTDLLNANKREIELEF